MKVKIGSSIYSSEDIPLLLILEEAEKEQIRNMPEDATKYLSYPDTMPDEEAMKILKGSS